MRWNKHIPPFCPSDYNYKTWTERMGQLSKDPEKKRAVERLAKSPDLKCHSSGSELTVYPPVCPHPCSSHPWKLTSSHNHKRSPTALAQAAGTWTPNAQSGENPSFYLFFFSLFSPYPAPKKSSCSWEVAGNRKLKEPKRWGGIICDYHGYFLFCYECVCVCLNQENIFFSSLSYAFII